MADQNSIAQRVKEIISKNLEIDIDKAVDGASLQDDLGADSLDAVEVIMALEDEFGIDIPDDAAEKLKSVGDVVQYVHDHQSK